MMRRERGVWVGKALDARFRGHDSKPQGLL